MLKTLKKNLAFAILSRRHFSDFLDLRAISALNHLNREELETYHLKQLRKILLYAFKNVSYWQNQLKSSGLAAAKINLMDFKDFESLPILVKEVFRSQEDLFYSEGWQSIPHLAAFTSGSSGLPLKITADKNCRARRLLLQIDYLRNFGLKNPKQFAHFWRSPALKNLGKAMVFSSFKNPDDIYKLLKENDIEGLGGTTSTLMIMAEDLRRKNAGLNLQFIHCGSEYLSEANREYLESVFKCPVYSKYVCAEFGILGYECKTQNGFHINPVNLFLEIVDENGKAILDNRPGRILITSFDNRIMPLIRYELGDNGRWAEGDCLCGLKMPRIYFEGRALHFLQLPGGAKYPVLNIINLFDQYYYDYVKQIQIIQESLDKIILRIVPTDNYESRGDVFFIRAALDRINCGKPISVSVEKVAEIPKLPSGKSQVFISKIN